ncbi:MAG: LLM class flavin-dependent oxidoreductase, partial [Anaerolineae bacterium]|nr:LLM class flavin-dependent oxidoreductase [Anaerolineae bacterium]
AKASQTPEETVKKIQSILGWPATKEQIHEAMQFVPDELIERITASGTPDEVRAKVAQYRQYGCTCPILYPLGDDVKLMIDTFAQC